MVLFSNFKWRIWRIWGVVFIFGLCCCGTATFSIFVSKLSNHNWFICMFWRENQCFGAKTKTILGSINNNGFLNPITHGGGLLDPDKFQNLTTPLRVISRPPTLTDFYGMSITVVLKKTRAFYMPRFSFGGNLKISESIILLLEKSTKLEKSEFL